jgi:hypothetical protein
MQLTYDPQELLKTHQVYEPVIFNGLRCHGGYDESGNYFSPRTYYRNQAINNWQKNYQLNYGESLIDIPISDFEPHYPNARQMKYLLSLGIYTPLIATLTRIGIVEGYGSLLRYVAVANLEDYFDDDISQMATGHLNKGLIEAHARDESGFENEVGHSRMWPLVRDLLFENPLNRSEVVDFLKKVNLIQDPTATNMPPIAQSFEQLIPEIDPSLETLIRRLMSVLLIELRAFRVFKWADEVIRTSDLSNVDEATKIVSFIRQDETPHVGYLTTVLSELKVLQFKGKNGKVYQGKPIIEKLLNHALNESRNVAEWRNVKMVSDEISLAISNRPNAQEILQTFQELSDRKIPEQFQVKLLN